jgi:threonine dehydratase
MILVESGIGGLEVYAISYDFTNEVPEAPLAAGVVTMLERVKPIRLAEARAAQTRLAGLTVVTPVVTYHAAPAGKLVRLKLENLQPIGSFKLRPVGNAVLASTREQLARGIYTSSSGNSALGVAWMARGLGIDATAVVPANAPEAKLEKLRELGARIQMISVEQWWQAIRTGSLGDASGLYIDAVRNPACLAGDATVGLEILEQYPDVEAIFVPFGGGGLACGVACAVREVNPKVKIIACELETAQPCKAALAAGGPVETAPDAGFISGVGFSTVLPEMWPLVSTYVDGAITVSIAEVVNAIRLMVEHNRVVAEGAGAIPVAAALSGRYEFSRVCAVVSGGNLDNGALTKILQGAVP